MSGRMACAWLQLSQNTRRMHKSDFSCLPALKSMMDLPQQSWMWQFPVLPHMGQVSRSGLKCSMQESKRDFDEVFIRIILQKSKFFLIIGNVHVRTATNGVAIYQDIDPASGTVCGSQGCREKEQTGKVGSFSLFLSGYRKTIGEKKRKVKQNR